MVKIFIWLEKHTPFVWHTGGDNHSFVTFHIKPFDFMITFDLWDGTPDYGDAGIKAERIEQGMKERKNVS